MKNTCLSYILYAFASPFSVAAADYTNIVLINLDDAGYGDFSCYGAQGYTTPNIDQLCADGVRFTHFLAGQPVSGASRAGLLTGRAEDLFPLGTSQLFTDLAFHLMFKS